MRRTLLIFLIMISTSVFADTYTAQIHFPGNGGVTYYDTVELACNSYNNATFVFHQYQTLDNCSKYFTPANGGGLYEENLNFFDAVYYCPSGGNDTITGGIHYCTNAPACTSPQVRNSSTGMCEDPPVTCTAGQTKTLLVLVGTYPENGTPTFKLNQDRTAVTEVHTTVSQGGCVYELPLNPNQNTGCSASPSGLLYCRVQATQTGALLSGADTALDAALTTDQTPVPTASNGCVKTQAGDEICSSTPGKNCGQVNGSDVCMTDAGLQSNGYPASIIDGQVVAEKTNENDQVQNCFVADSGKTVCIERPESTSCTRGLVCFETEPTAANPTPKIIPITKDVQEVSKTANVTNPDGTRTETITKTNNIQGSTPTVITNTYNSNGDLTGSSTQKGDSMGKGNTDGTARSGQSGAGDGVAGQWYTESGKTYQSVMESGLSGLQATPIMSFGKDIFNVSVPAGTRPVFDIPSVTPISGLPPMPAIHLDPLGADFMPGVWLLVSSVLKIISVFMAYKIAVSAFS